MDTTLFQILLWVIFLTEPTQNSHFATVFIPNGLVLKSAH